MEKCTVFVHPSLYEGFGIPPLEALSCGARVMVSDSTCLPEIFMDSVVYFHPDELCPDIDKLLAHKCSDTTNILNKYDWENSARKLNEIIYDTLRNK